jgi:hypothetical protein
MVAPPVSAPDSHRQTRLKPRLRAKFGIAEPLDEKFRAFGFAVCRVDGNDTEALVVTSASRGSGKLTHYGETLPDQIVELSIAEQNVVGVSAGLASAGKKVFAASPACFITARGLEQIKNDVAYSDQPVRIIRTWPGPPRSPSPIRSVTSSRPCRPKPARRSRCCWWTAAPRATKR